MKKSLFFLITAAVLMINAACAAASGADGDYSALSAQESDETAQEDTEEINFSGSSLLDTTDIEYLTMEVGSDDTQLRFNWFSPSADAGMVEWTNADTGEIYYFEADCFASENREGYYVNKAVVTGVERGVSYTYRVGNDDAWSPEYSYTLTGETDTLTFLVTADTQLGQAAFEDREVTSLRWNSVLEELVSAFPDAEFILHVGDHVACFGSARDYELFLDHKVLYSIPLAPVVGNHDVPDEWNVASSGYAWGDYFYEQLNVPNLSELGSYEDDSNDGDYYFVRGDVLFLVINNMNDSEEEHRRFIAETIAENSEYKWRVLSQHYPAFEGVESEDEATAEWIIAAANEYDIDLVLTGHEHAYSRSGFVNADMELLEDYTYESGSTAVNPEGVLFITCSTSSGCLYHDTVSEEHLVFQGQPEKPMALTVEVSENELHVTAYTTDPLEVYDEYTIYKD